MNDEYQEQGYRWTPPDNMTNHGGKDLSDKDDFFAPPPPEIGEVTSAYTSLRTDKHPWPMGTRVGLGFFIGCILAVIAFFIMMLMEAVPLFMVLVPLGAAGLGLLIVLLATGCSHTCHYVGNEGVAEFKSSGNRDNIASSNICPFGEAAELRTSQVRRYVNGVYQGTSYTFTWSDKHGRQRYVIQGQHNSERGTPPAKNNYHYAGAAELAWSNYLLGFVADQLQQDGYLHFSLGGADYVRVGPDYLELRVSGQTTQCAADDIKAINLNAGMFTIKEKGAKEGWFSSKGVFKFNYNALANAQLFAFVLKKLTGWDLFGG